MYQPTVFSPHFSLNSFTVLFCLVTFNIGITNIIRVVVSIETVQLCCWFLFLATAPPRYRKRGRESGGMMTGSERVRSRQTGAPEVVC